MKRVAIVSPKEIAKDQGKPLSKYERNMMIFDWLHALGKKIKWNIIHWRHKNIFYILDESAPETSEKGEKDTEKDIEKEEDEK